MATINPLRMGGASHEHTRLALEGATTLCAAHASPGPRRRTTRAINDEQHVLAAAHTRVLVGSRARNTSASGARERPERIATGRASRLMKKRMAC